MNFKYSEISDLKRLEYKQVLNTRKVLHLKGTLQYPCLENPMDRGAWRATAHGVAESVTAE